MPGVPNLYDGTGQIWEPRAANSWSENDWESLSVSQAYVKCSKMAW